MTRVGNVAKRASQGHTIYCPCWRVLLPCNAAGRASKSSKQVQQVRSSQVALSTSRLQAHTGSRLCLPFMTQLFIQFNQAVSSILLHSIRPGLPLTSSFVHSPAYGRESFGLGRVFRWRVRVRTLNDTKSTRGGLCRQVSSSVVGVVG